MEQRIEMEGLLEEEDSLIGQSEHISDPLLFLALTKEELDTELQKGWDDIQKGRLIPWEEVESKFEREYGITL